MSVRVNVRMSKIMRTPIKVGVCVCVCACVFISFHCFSWLNKTVNVMPEIRSAMLSWGNYCVKYLRRHLTDRGLQASNCERVSIKPGRATRNTRQLLKPSKIPTVKARSIATYPLTNLDSRPATAQRRTVTKWTATYKRTVTTPKGVL